MPQTRIRRKVAVAIVTFGAPNGDRRRREGAAGTDQ